MPFLGIEKGNMLSVSISGGAYVSNGMMVRYFGVEAQFWLNLQTEYNLRMVKRKIWADIER